MTITCPKCKAKLKLSEEKERPEGTRIKCPKCTAVLVYKGKARKELPEKEGEIPAAMQPPASGQFAAPPPVSEARNLPGPEDRPPEASLSPTAREGPAVRAPGTGAAQTIKEPAPMSRAKLEAPRADETSLPAGKEEKRALPGKTVMVGSAVAVFVIMLIAILFFRSLETGPSKQKKPVPAVGASQPQAPAPVTSQESTPAVVPEAPTPVSVPPDETSFSTPEEKAIAMVKRSDVLLKMTTVEAIVDKWRRDNAGRYTFKGWQAKQIEDERYLVSYTAFEGDAPKGFYFVADLSGGTVEDLAHNQELQKKYNIQYTR